LTNAAPLVTENSKQEYAAYGVIHSFSLHNNKSHTS